MNTNMDFFTMESLSEDIERDFLNRNTQIQTWKGKMGKYVVDVLDDPYKFAESLMSYCKTRVYMHVKVINFNHLIPSVTVVSFELL